MGQTQSLVYSVDVPGQKQPDNSTKIRRRPEFVNGLVDSPDPELKTLQLILQRSFNRFADNDCIGQIVSKPAGQSGKVQKQVVYKKYRQVSEIADALDKAIHDLNLCPEIEEVPGLKLRFVGIFSKNRAEWLQVDVMTILKGYVVVPIYDTLGVENIPFILNHTNMTTVFCSKPSLDILLQCQNLGALKNIISFDPVDEQMINTYKEKGVTIHIYKDLIKKYLKSDVKVEKRIYGPSDVVAFCYTSGTTGPPKGAMLSQKNFAAYSAVLMHNPDLQLSENDTHLSYLPLAHILENVCVLAMFVYGGRICAFSGDTKNIKSDLQLSKPTFFMSVPRLYNKFYEVVKDNFSKVQGWKKTLLDKGLATKLHNAAENGSYSHMVYDRTVFNKTKDIFGGKCRFLASGSAPLTTDVHYFMKAISCAPVMEGYGQTESTGVSFMSAARDAEVGHVGGPSSMVEYKLLDIPEMNYTHNDKDDKGRPMPRGQILIRGPGVFLGYYKDEQKTKETINEEGWLHTGDVGAVLPSTKALKIIDRKKNIFKLQQGEYVASERVENVYTKKDDMVAEMFLYGDSMQNFCVAVISPVKASIEKIAQEKGIQGSFEELCKNKDVRTEYISQLNSFSKKQGLKGFQQPKNVFLQPLTFQEKNIMTTTMKLQRFAAKNVYKSEIEGMYKEGVLGNKPAQ